MLRHNLILFFRNIKRYKSTFVINIVGLSSGLACVLLIYLWMNSELSVDKFHEKDAQLFQVLRNVPISSGDIMTFENNSDLLVPLLKEELVEIEYAVPVTGYSSLSIISVGDKKIKSSGKLAGKDFFKVFSFSLIEGNDIQALKGENSIVISKKVALALFNRSEGLIGEIVNIQDNAGEGAVYDGDYNISGIIDTEGVNSSLEFDFLLTNELFLAKRDPSNASWNSNGVNVYLTLREGTDAINFEDKINKYYRSKLEVVTNEKYHHQIADMFLQRYSERYLYNRFENGELAGGRIDYVILFSLVALIILLIACINFINLSTALASRRLKEVGIKKVVGASKKTFIIQFIGESISLSFISLIVAIGIVLLLLPQFNLITAKEISLQFNSKFIAATLIITLCTGLISGSYPAFFLSSLKPVEILKTKLKSTFGEFFTRRGLVVFQFSMSIIFIISVIIISNQMNFLQSKNLGYNKDNVISFLKEGKLSENSKTFIEELKRIPGVINATQLESNISSFSNSGGGYKREGKPYIQFTFARVDYDYVETLGIVMKEGRSFSRDFGDEKSKIILNEAAIKAMELEDPLGKIVNIRGNREIIGIVKDFHYQSLYKKIAPMFLLFVPKDADRIAVKIKAGREKETIASLEQIYHKLNPGLSFEFEFLDDEYQSLYASEQRVAALSGYFAFLAILISCLGLLGLSIFTIENRRKEIGIRKTLGQRKSQITLLLSTEFAKLVGIAILIGLPIAFLLMKDWLSEFAYRIDLKIEYFLITAFFALFVALVTVATQAIRAANRNPVDALREE